MLRTPMNISEIAHEKCTGCAVCVSLCPVNAIEMKKYKDGFFYPSLDNRKCINCGLCYNHCHTISDNRMWNKDVCYAGYYKDSKLLAASSSGGAATAISKCVILWKGTVYGVRFQSNFTQVIYDSANTEIDLEKFKTSKYIQAQAPDYSEIKKKLNNNELVAFIGLPCQCDALHSYLDREYSNLILVSLVCHGPTSPLILEKYLEELNEKYGKVKELKLRYKKRGYTRPSRIYFVSNDGKKHIKPFITSSFGMAFELLNRESCSNCHAKYPGGFADIILGDFWGGKDSKSKQSERGESLIILRNQSKKYLINALKDEGFIIEEASLNGLESKNPALVSSVKMKENRARFVEDLQNVSLKSALKKNISKKERAINTIYYYLRCLVPRKVWSMFR